MPIDPVVDQALRQYEEAKQDRLPFDSNWREIEELVVPIRGSNIGSSFVRSPGQIINARVFDSTAVFANEEFAAMLASQLINPALKWFELFFRNTDLNNNEDGVRWLATIRDVALNIINQPETHFHQSAHEFFLDLGGYGTGAQTIVETMGSVPLYFETRPIQSVHFRENSKGLVDTVFLSYRFTAAQAIDFYGKDTPQKIVEHLTKKGSSNQTFTFVNVLWPSGLYVKPNKRLLNRPIHSLHIFLDDKVLVKEGSFEELPIVVARLAKLSGETMGRGPGMNMLPDIRMLQRVSEVVIRAAQKNSDPPMLIPDEGVIGPLRTSPGGLTIIRQGLRNEPKQLYTSPIGVEVGRETIRDLQQTILRGFYLNPADFVPPEPRVSATAILDRRDERFRRMTPLIMRLQSEWLAPKITRVLGILGRKGLLPKRPQNIPVGAIVDVKFTSPAAQAQLLNELDGMVRFLSRNLPIFELDPDAVLNIETDKWIHKTGQLTMLDPELLRPLNTVKMDRKARSEQRAQMAAMEQENLKAQAAERMGRAVKATSETA
jgi:hypothetical protein